MENTAKHRHLPEQLSPEHASDSNAQFCLDTRPPHGKFSEEQFITTPGTQPGYQATSRQPGLEDLHVVRVKRTDTLRLDQYPIINGETDAYLGEYVPILCGVLLQLGPLLLSREPSVGDPVVNEPCGIVERKKRGHNGMYVPVYDGVDVPVSGHDIVVAQVAMLEGRTPHARVGGRGCQAIS
ncbi:hypothetical protein EWM64_g5753 [Hericium alpestre]|uniref:Uncharacterized protein n=1 Tax=Hericium alpestre TaxID=135208 RepID=A0A4Y9ZWI1_9AGAM|nr:hypothetical protein EWM64_g5753 [Hericium alpestre]